MKKKTIAIILAGGSSKRMGKNLPKQFLEVAGKPLIVHALEKFSRKKSINGIIVVSLEKYLDRSIQIIADNKVDKVIDVIPGGATRQESSYIGIKRCPDDTQFVLIHDSARPFVDNKIIDDVLRAAVKYGAAAPAMEISDTVIFEKDGFVDKIPPRKTLKRIQTPQGFSYETICKAHEQSRENGITNATDDCGLVRNMNSPVRIVEGDPANIKITDRYDIETAEKATKDPEGKGGL